VGAVLVVAALAGCSSGPSLDAIAAAAHTVDSTLAVTKASAQLLRNEAADRLPQIIVKEVVDTMDGSSACLPEAEDPTGIARFWSSSTTITVVNSQAARINTVTDALAAGFVEQGWALEGSTLVKPDSTSTIEVTVKEKADGQKPAVHIEVVGPCVITGGIGSDELDALEKAATVN
jgi:hypothetical protein